MHSTHRANLDEAAPHVRFTIVTPVFNGMPWLPDAVMSVARQRDDVDVEHIVLDGGSTDGSREWLAGHPELGCRLVFEPDGGQTDALVRGFDLASGEIFGWLNADDLLEPGALRHVAAVMADQPDAAIVSGACLFIDAYGAITGVVPTPPLPTFAGLVNHRSNPPQPSTFFRATAYREVGGLDRRYDLAMDLELWMRLVRRGRYVTLPDTVLARYRVHPDAKTERLSTASTREDMAIRRRYGMPIRSPAGIALIRAAYVSPVVRPVRRMVRRAIRRILLLGTSDRPPVSSMDR